MELPLATARLANDAADQYRQVGQRSGFLRVAGGNDGWHNARLWRLIEPPFRCIGSGRMMDSTYLD